MAAPGAAAVEVRAVGTVEAAAHGDDLAELLLALSGCPPEPVEQVEVVLASPPEAAGGGAGSGGPSAGWRPDLRLQHDLQPSSSGRNGEEDDRRVCWERVRL